MKSVFAVMSSFIVTLPLCGMQYERGEDGRSKPIYILRAQKESLEERYERGHFSFEKLNGDPKNSFGSILMQKEKTIAPLLVDMDGNNVMHMRFLLAHTKKDYLKGVLNGCLKFCSLSQLDQKNKKNQTPFDLFVPWYNEKRQNDGNGDLAHFESWLEKRGVLSGAFGEGFKQWRAKKKVVGSPHSLVQEDASALAIESVLSRLPSICDIL